jgi:hypothetical protein
VMGNERSDSVLGYEETQGIRLEIYSVVIKNILCICSHVIKNILSVWGAVMNNILCVCRVVIYKYVVPM